MAQSNSEIRVIFRPEGVKDVIDGLRIIQRESRNTERASQGGISGFANLFATREATGFAGALNQIGTIARRLIPVLGFSGASAALIGMGRDAIQTASDVSKLQQQFKLTAEELTTLQFAARTNESSNEELERGLQGLAKSQRELRAGVDDTSAAYADLNLKASDFQGLNLGQSLELIARQMQGIDPTRLDLDAILGRGARALIPTLNELATKGLAGVRKEGERVGAVLGGEATANAKSLGDAAQLVRERVGGLSNTLTGEFQTGIKAGVGGLDAMFATLNRLVKLDVRGAIDEQIQSFKGLARGAGEFLGILKPQAAQPRARAAAGPDPAVQRQIIEATKRQSEEQFKILAEESKRRRELAEESIESERRIAVARTAGSRDQLEASRQVLAADIKALNERVRVASDFAEREKGISRAKFETDIRLAQQASATTAGFELRKADLTRKFAQEQTRINQAYYADLKRLEADFIAQYRTSKEAQKALDEEVRQNRRRAQDFGADAAIAGTGPVTQEIELRKRGEERIAELKKAAAEGDIERARQLRGEIESLAGRIGGLDSIFAGQSAQALLNEANTVFEGVAAKAKQIEQQRESAAQTALKQIGEAAREVEKVINDINSKPANLRVTVQDSELQNMTRQIQDALNRTPFQIAVTPIVQGGGASFADGGRVPGTAPHPRADNVLARLTPGEFVQPVAAMRKYGLGFMERVRTLQYPAYADGGLISAGASDSGSSGRMELALTINGRKRGSIFGSQEVIRDIADVLRQVAD